MSFCICALVGLQYLCSSRPTVFDLKIIVLVMKHYSIFCELVSILSHILSPVMCLSSSTDIASLSIKSFWNSDVYIFAILNIPMRTKLFTSKIITMACAVLHNTVLG